MYYFGLFLTILIIQGKFLAKKMAKVKLWVIILRFYLSNQECCNHGINAIQNGPLSIFINLGHLGISFCKATCFTLFWIFWLNQFKKLYFMYLNKYNDVIVRV